MKYDSLDISHKKLLQDHSNLAKAHSFEIQQIRGYLADAKSKPSKTLDSIQPIQHADKFTPGQLQHKTQTHGSSQGSNLGQRSGEGETGTKNGSDLGSVRGPGVVSDSITGNSTSTPNNEQSQIKPLHIRDPNKRLIDSSTSPALVKITNIGTDSGDDNMMYDTDDTDDTPFTVVKRDRRRFKPKDALISGIKRETGIKVYVQNIHRKHGQSLREIANNVRKYCASKNVRSMNAFVIRNKVVDDIVGCQLTIPMRFYDTVIADRFWPSEVVCKKWEDKTTTGQSRDPPNREPEIISGQSRSRSQERKPSARGRKWSAWSDRTRSISRDSRSSSWNKGPRK